MFPETQNAFCMFTSVYPFSCLSVKRAEHTLFSGLSDFTVKDVFIYLFIYFGIKIIFS